VRAKRRLGEPGIDAIEEAMMADLEPEALMSDATALEFMRNPEQYADHPLPPGLWRWVYAQPDGARIWDIFIREVWTATDNKCAAKRVTQTVS
jgi:hypothetical protein